jgi:hypothetical protein
MGAEDTCMHAGVSLGDKVLPTAEDRWDLRTLFSQGPRQRNLRHPRTTFVCDFFDANGSSLSPTWRLTA